MRMRVVTRRVDPSQEFGRRSELSYRDFPERIVVEDGTVIYGE